MDIKTDLFFREIFHLKFTYFFFILLSTSDINLNYKSRIASLVCQGKTIRRKNTREAILFDFMELFDSDKLIMSLIKNN